MKNIITLFTLTSFFAFGTRAQVTTPRPSPHATSTQEVGLSTISIDYYRPGVKGRVIFGDLVPYGVLWRTGANGSTDVQFSEDVNIQGEALPAGNYALYTIPGETSWEVIFYTETEHWGTPAEWSDDKVALQVTVEPYKVAEKIETLYIGIEDVTNSSATLALRWANVVVPVEITLDTDAAVEASIAETMAGPSADDYLQAARYYHDEGKDLTKALEWINKSIDMAPGKFWVLRTKSQIQANLGDFRGAVETAGQSKALAMEAGNDQYVKYNEEAIAEWSKHIK